MSDFMEKFWGVAGKILCLGLLALIWASPVMAQEQTPKKETAPPVKKAPCSPKAKAPSPARMKLRGLEGPESEGASPGMKKTTRKIGGQEIRAKEGEEEKK